MIDTKSINELYNLIKKFGVGIILFMFFLWNYNSLNIERKDIQESFKKTTNDTIVVLIKMEERLNNIEKNLDNNNIEIKELRYELRTMNGALKLKDHRYINE